MVTVVIGIYIKTIKTDTLPNNSQNLKTILPHMLTFINIELHPQPILMPGFTLKVFWKAKRLGTYYRRQHDRTLGAV